MSEFLFIRLSEDAEAATSVVLDSNGRMVRAERTDPLAEVRSDADGRRVVVLVSPSEVVTTDVAVPKAGQARVRQMVPFSLEEALAADIDTLHFAAGAWSSDGRVSVSVVAKSRLEAWLAALEAAAIDASAMYAASDGVADTPATLNLVLEGSVTAGRRPGSPPFCVEGLTLAEVLDLLEEQREDRSDLQHVMAYLDAAAVEIRKPELVGLKARIASVDAKLSDSILARLGASLVFAPGTNLLQGPYAPKSNVGPLLRPWYAAAGLAAGLVLVALVGQAAEYLSLAREDRALASQISEICSRGYSTAAVDGCRAEMRRRLAAAGQSAGAGGEGFLSTLAAFATYAGDSSRLEALNYRSDVMDLQLTVPSVTVLDEMSREINSTERFTMNIQSNTQGDEGAVNSRIQILSDRQ